MSNWLIDHAQAAVAQPLVPGPDTSIAGNPQGIGVVFANLGDKAFEVITIIAGIVAVIYTIWYGIQYVTSSGSPDKIKLARSGLINSIIGVVIIVATYAIIRLAFSIANSVNQTIR